MYIPGINYNRRVYSSGQEDAGRFASLARSASQPMMDAIKLENQAATAAYNVKAGELGLEQGRENAAMIQKGYDLNNKWATINGAIDLAGTIVNDVLTPIYNQKASNEEAESNRVYQQHMEALDLKIKESPTRIDEETGKEVSNADRLHDMYMEGERVAIEEASKGITIPEVRKSQMEQWSNNNVTNQGTMNALGVEWEKSMALNDFTREYDMRLASPSMENLAVAESMLHDASKNHTIDAAVYATNLGKLRTARQDFYVETKLNEIRGTENVAAQDELMLSLESEINDSYQLQMLGPEAENQALGVLASVRKARVTRASQLRTQQKQYEADLTDAAKGRIALLQIDIAGNVDDSIYLQQEWTSFQIDLALAYEDINKMDLGSTERTKAQGDIDKAIESRIANIGSGLLDRDSPVGGEDAFSEFREAIVMADAADMGFLNPLTARDAQSATLSTLDAIAKQHKARLVAQEEARIINNAVTSFDSGLYTPPTTGKTTSFTAGFEVTKTEDEEMDAIYSQFKVSGKDVTEFDRLAFGQFKDIPDQMDEDLKNSFLSTNRQDLGAAVQRLDAIRLMTNRDGHSTGKVYADKLVEGLPAQARASYEYWNEASRDGTITEEEDQIFSEVVAYNIRATPQQREDDAANVRAATKEPKQKQALLEKVMEHQGYPSDMIKMAVENPNLYQEMDKVLDRNAGLYHPAIAANLATAEVLRDFGLTDRQGLVQTQKDVLETVLNGGMPMRHLKRNHRKWQETHQITDAFDEGGMIEKVYPAINDDATPKLDDAGEQMWEATYTDEWGRLLRAEDGTVFTYQPDPYNFPEAVADRKKAQADANKATYLLGQEALAQVELRYPDMQDDYFNPKSWGYIGTPFEEFRTDAEKEAAALSNVRTGNMLPSRWWTSFDPNQKKARELSHKEEQYIRVQIESKFDRWLEEEGMEFGTDGNAHVLAMRSAAYEAALWNAKHNDRAYPDFDENTFELVYPMPEDRYDVPISGLESHR